MEKRFGPEPMTVITIYKSEGPEEEANPGPHLQEVRDEEPSARGSRLAYVLRPSKAI